MRKIALRDAKTHFNELLDAAQREPMAIEEHGGAVAVIISVEDYFELETLMLQVLRTKAQRGLADVDAGRVANAQVVFAELEDMINGAER